MKFIVFGAGALGSLIGGLLSTHHHVLLVGRKGHIEAIKRGGLIIEGKTKGIFHPSTEATEEKYDLVILTTKAYDTSRAAAEIKKRFGILPVLSLQNGLRNEEILAEFFGEENVIGGVTSEGATFLENGRIFHAGKGETIIGEMDGKISNRVEKIAEAFNECGIKTKISTDIKKEIWRKAVINASINTITSILKCKNGFLVENKNAEKLLEMVCMECISIAAANGVDIGKETIEKTKDVARKTAENYSSMLQDLMRGKRTEVEEINGEFVKAAKKIGMEAKVNEFILHAIKAMENVRHLG